MVRTICARGVCAIWLAAVLWTGVAALPSHASFRVVPEEKTASAAVGVAPSAAGRDEKRGGSGPAPAGGTRINAEPASKCAEELTTLSLGAEDAAGIERLRRQRCR
jgi:hypothetical protein